MNPALKYKLFEYMIDGIVEWYKDVDNKVDVNNELNLLKLIKLNFFVTAASTIEKKEGLLRFFDDFRAMPFGHVESGIYDQIKLPLPPVRKYHISRTNLKLEITTSEYYDEIEVYKVDIDNAINLLRMKNENLVKYKSFDLVELSHQWASWRLVFNIAKSKGLNSMPIPKELIINENKFYHLKSVMNVS